LDLETEEKTIGFHSSIRTKKYELKGNDFKIKVADSSSRLTSLSWQQLLCDFAFSTQHFFSEASTGVSQISSLEKTEETDAIFPSQKCTLNANPELETNRKNAIIKLMCLLNFIL
jgi:hypothetical protein